MSIRERVAAIAIGSNLGGAKRLEKVESAVKLIAKSVGPIVRTSNLYETAAYHPDPERRRSMPSFLNAVVLASTRLCAGEVVNKLLNCEASLGRVRSSIAGSGCESRVADLDLLLLDDTVEGWPSLGIDEEGNTMSAVETDRCSMSE